MAFRSEDPPHSRLFVICQKGISEQDFRDKFGEYGKIDDIWVVKDKRTNEDRGIVYVKFSRTSEALLAMEEMNGRCMPGQQKPLKVVVANSKRDGSTRDPKEEEKLVRLFVICPKSFQEKELREEFEKYGDLDHVTIVRDRSSGESKGFGYVKYHRPYHAAVAFEQCSQTYKPKFAEPQRSRGDREREENSDFYSFGGSHSSSGGGGGGGGFRENENCPVTRYTYFQQQPGQKRNFEQEGDGSYFGGGGQGGHGGGFGMAPPAMGGSMGGPMQMIQDFPVTGNCSRIQIVAPIGMTQGYLTKLFNLVPGMEYCDLNESTGVAYARYATPQCAAYAKEKLHGFEYPIGSQLMVQLAEEGMQTDPSPQGYDSSGGYGSSSHEPNDLRSRAASLLEKAGINPSMVMANNAGAMSAPGPGGARTERVNYCNIMLPMPQPMVDEALGVAQRLFIVCQPAAVGERVLKDAFCRFGNLIDVFLLAGRNYGYAKFANKDSAMKAIQVLHGQNLSGQRIKVLEAEPPKSGDEGPAKKQMKL